MGAYAILTAPNQQRCKILVKPKPFMRRDRAESGRNRRQFETAVQLALAMISIFVC